MSSDVPALKVHAFPCNDEFWIGVNEYKKQTFQLQVHNIFIY